MEGHEPIYTVGEVAALMRHDEKTIRRWIAAGKLEAFLTPGGQWRIRKSAVRALLANLDAGPGSLTPPKVMTPPTAGSGPDSKEGRVPRGGARPNPAT